MLRRNVLQSAVLVALIGTLLVGSTIAAPTNKDINQTKKALQTATKDQVKALKATEKEFKTALNEVKKGDDPILAVFAIDLALRFHYENMLKAHRKAMGDMDEALADFYKLVDVVPNSSPLVRPEFGLTADSELMKQVSKARKDLQKSVDRTNKQIDSIRKHKLFKDDQAKIAHLGCRFPIFSAPNQGSLGEQVKGRTEGPVAHFLGILGHATGEMYVYLYTDPSTWGDINPSLKVMDGNGNEIVSPINNGGMFRVGIGGWNFENETTVNMTIVTDGGITLASTDFTVPGKPVPEPK